MSDPAPATFALEEGEPGSGPIVWASIIATTCLLLFLFQKILWLVVPFLLALILYYFLYPPMQVLIYRGMSRDAAASCVTLGFVTVMVIVGVALAPWVARHIAGWQDIVDAYSKAGAQLLDRSLRALEAHWPTLARAHVADNAAARLAQSADSLADHVEPILVGILAWAPSLMLAPFLAFFFLRDGRRFQRFLGGAVPNAFFEKTLYLLHEIDYTSRAYFQGLAWIPYVGSIVGGLLVVLVAATDFPDTPSVAYWAIVLFVVVRMLDDFVYMPLTIGKSLELHPLVTVLMIFVGGAVAGVSGLMLVLPVLGVVMVIGETIGVIVTDPRLMARHRHALALRRDYASSDL